MFIEDINPPQIKRRIAPKYKPEERLNIFVIFYNMPDYINLSVLRTFILEIEFTFYKYIGALRLPNRHNYAKV